ncbi:glycosyltransferase family 87 protein [Paraburkholderia sp. J94]|uniref:glycosyltransferase family 87 protein n=1 Tax=Paraburkholderia sp. J94 TaxID=2805441 RepID=UPI002AAFA4E4|nr:glycosyltransferase family 87 protein [Paraburkholderia sp. J94]
MSIKHHWLDRERFTNYPRILLGMFILAAICWIVMSKDMVDMKGKPLGYDFITFWAASHLALAGHAADAYQIPLLFAAEKIGVPASQSVFVWYYPPTFYLLVLPLALLPYIVAYWAFILPTLCLYLLALRRVVWNTHAKWCIAAFPGLWMNIFHGQNAFLTATLAAAAVLCLKRRPVLAGVFIGLLAIKPHLALLFPVALLAIGAWRAIIAAATTAVIFLALGSLTLGTPTLTACLGSLRYARVFLEGGFLPWPKMPTAFALMRLLGAPVGSAYLVHAIGAGCAVLAVWFVWRRSQDWGLRGAALMTATFLVSPYVFDYDLAWLAFPIAWLALIGLRDGWLRGEREVLVAAWLLPVVMSPLASALHLQVAPFVLACLLGMNVRRVALVAKRSQDRSCSGRDLRGSAI